MISSAKENSETSRGSKQHNHDERANVGGDSCGGSVAMRQQQQAVTGTMVAAQLHQPASNNQPKGGCGERLKCQSKDSCLSM